MAFRPSQPSFRPIFLPLQVPEPSSSVFFLFLFFFFSLWMCPSCLVPYPIILCHCSNNPCSRIVLLTYSTPDPRARFSPFIFGQLFPCAFFPVCSTFPLFSRWVSIRSRSVTEHEFTLPQCPAQDTVHLTDVALSACSLSLSLQGWVNAGPLVNARKQRNNLPSAPLPPSLSTLSHLYLGLSRGAAAFHSLKLHKPTFSSSSCGQ